MILEEIAIDSVIKQTEMNLLNEARDLHMSSLKLALKAFNENNVQTAKHYGNLGRLYQSMKLFEVCYFNNWVIVITGSYNCVIIAQINEFLY